MSERSCSVCGLPEALAGALAVAMDAGHVVTGAFRPDAPQPTSDPRQVFDYANAGHEVLAGDLVCWRHIAVRPNGNYVRVEDGA